MSEPTRTLLLAPAPNPARGAATVSYALAHASAVHLVVYDIGGRRVRTLVGGEFMLGRRELTFDGRDDAGRVLPPGIYRVRARIGSLCQCRGVCFRAVAQAHPIVVAIFR